VKWIEDRLEHFVSAAQEREQIHTVEIAFTRDGTLLALRDVFTHDIGMYGALVAPVITACTVPGPYRIPNTPRSGRRTPICSRRGPCAAPGAHRVCW
jgi:CO/xanthine dehydrogenase Mo-binding subunit